MKGSASKGWEAWATRAAKKKKKKRKSSRQTLTGEKAGTRDVSSWVEKFLSESGSVLATAEQQRSEDPTVAHEGAS